MASTQIQPAELTWKVKEKGEQAAIDRLCSELNIDRVLANLLVQRGIITYEGAKAFFRPSLDHLHDPFLMKGMEKAVDRLNQAFQNKEKILIYGDYDVDGTTSVALVYIFLKEFYDQLAYYIPERYSEGYGISYKGIDYAAANGYSLVISLDCGIKANDKIEYARQKGVEFIICDHHTPGNTVPDACSVLDPKQKDCVYPYKELSGCGVGFKFLQAYAQKHDIPFDRLSRLLDLVAVSIASDIVPLTGENRILAYYGLKKLNESPINGLNAIIKSTGLTDREIQIEDIVFKIGPRINAAGRMDSGEKAVDLLITWKPEEAESMGKIINICNNSRKNIDRKITEEALEMIISDESQRESKTTVLYHHDWHEGVLGIVASRVKDYFYRPTVILTHSNGMVTGSARSVEHYDLYHAVEACSDLLENFGGHRYAAGLTLRPENIEAFRERFEQEVTKTITREQLTPSIEVDDIISLDEITPKFFRILKQFQPFGPENMAPVFVTRNVADNGCGRIVGNTREHLKLELIQEQNPMHAISGIAFQKAHHYEEINMGNPFDICYNIEENHFMGKTTLQIKIKDMKVNTVVLKEAQEKLSR